MTTNMKMSVKQTDGHRTLTIEVDLDQDFGPTSTGRALLVAGTQNWMPIPGAEDTAIALTCTRKLNGGKYGRRTN